MNQKKILGWSCLAMPEMRSPTAWAFSKNPNGQQQSAVAFAMTTKSWSA
jgi:hypothetical protein